MKLEKRFRLEFFIVITIFLLVNRVNSLTGSDLAASLGLLNSLPVLYGEVEPTDPTEYSPGTSYQFQVNISDINGADTIDTVFFEWDGSLLTEKYISKKSKIYFTK